MANTTKERVLLIAPELATKINNVYQKTQIAIVSFDEGLDFEIMVNDYTAFFTSDSTTTKNDVLPILMDLLNNNLEGITAYMEGELLSLEGSDDHITFYVAVNATLSNTIITEGKDNDSLFQLVLEDIIIQVTEEDPVRFREEQERAQRYLVAHLLTLINMDPNDLAFAKPIVKEYVGDVQYHYESRALKSMDEAFFLTTPYGEVFYDIYKRRYFRFL